MRPAAGQQQGLLAAIWSGQPMVGGVAVHLQNAVIAREMPQSAVAGTTVLEAVGDHRRIAAAKGPVVSRIGP